MEQAQVTPGRSPIRGLVKGLLWLVVKPMVHLVIFWRRHTLIAFMLLMAIVGGLMYMSTNPVALPLVSTSASSASGAPSSPRVAAEAYLTGQERFDAKMMWEAMSDDYRQAMTQRGRSLETTQRQLEQWKQGGLSFSGYQYVGGATLKDGSSVHLYVISRTVPTNQGARVEQLPYTFTMDRSGKIINIE